MRVKDSKRLALLGAGGFLGSHLTRALLERTDYDLVALDLDFDKLEIQSPRLQCVLGSVADTELITNLIQRSAVVISCTALCNPALYNTQPTQVIAANFSDLVPVVQLCTQHRKRLIHFSTCEVYGRGGMNPSQAFMQEDAGDLVLGPIAAQRWSYASAKQLLERLIWAQMEQFQLEATIVRPFNVIGPKMDWIKGIDGAEIPRVVANFMSSMLQGEPLVLVDGGKHFRTFLYVEDFVDALIRIVMQPVVCRGQIFNLGNPANEITIAHLAEKMRHEFKRIYGQEVKTKPVAAADYYGPGYDDSIRRIPDITKAKKLLGWTPTTSLDQMLGPIIQDYVQRYGNRRT